MKTIKFTYLLTAACLGILFTTGCASDRSHRRQHEGSYKKECSKDSKTCSKKKTCPPDCEKPCCKKK